MEESDKRFIQGIAYSVAILKREMDEPGLASIIIFESGFNFQDFKDADVAEFDLKEVKRVFQSESRLKSRK